MERSRADRRHSSALQVNSQVKSCDFGKPNQCSGGLVCQRSSACFKVFCDATDGILVQQCSGLCQPAERLMLSARFSNDAAQVTSPCARPAGHQA
jgi:hypothetical protein